MTARLLRWLLLVQALAVGGGALWLAHAGLAWALALPAALLAVLGLRLLICWNNFALSWRANRAAGASPLRARVLLRMLVREYVATMRSTSWDMLRPHATLRLHRPGPVAPVLLVHGYGCNSGYWGALARRLDAAGISHAGLDLEPVFAPLEAYVPALEAAVAALCAATGAAQVTLVAHSMGGLAARAWLRAHGTQRLARLITVGTPHHGTRLAAGGVGANARQMRWRSPWLDRLAAAEAPELRARITSIYTEHDNIVTPASSARLAGARLIALRAIGHVALGRDPQVLACVMQEICDTACAQ